VPGLLVPIGPVECGQLPPPPQRQCEPDDEECSDADKLTAATKFGAVMTRVGGGLKDVPWIGKFFKWLPFDVEVGVAAVSIGTLDESRPALMRAFAFEYGRIGGSSGGLDKQAAFEQEATSTKPLRLATRDPDGILSPSDFDAGVRSPAKLVIKGASNMEELHVGGMTFTFSGALCNSGGDRTVYGC
jgi:hypothetical protein